MNWFELSDHYGNVALNEFIIMPDHFYGVITITQPCKKNTNCHIF